MIQSINKVLLADGIYHGFMGGYTVEIPLTSEVRNCLVPNYVIGNSYVFNTNIGLRGMCIHVKVNVKNGIATIETK
jgi:hypothetical protein